METLAQQRRKASKPLLWIGIASIIMAFAGLTSGYVVSRTSLLLNEEWVVFELPQAFVYSTVLMVLSSVLFLVGKKQFASGNMKPLKPMLWGVVLLGVAFVAMQGQAWKELMSEEIFFAGAASHPAGSWVYALFLFHAAHVIGGIIALLAVLIRSYRGRYSSEDYHGVTLVGIYWHFVDLLWVYLYVFLSVIR
jgi:cytochrome c oxidase subunit 3